MLKPEEDVLLRSLILVGREESDDACLSAYSTLLSTHVKFSDDFYKIFEFITAYYDNSVGFPTKTDTIHHFKNKGMYNLVKIIEGICGLPKLTSEEFVYRMGVFKHDFETDVVLRAFSEGIDYINQKRQESGVNESVAEKAMSIFSDKTSELYVANSLVRTSGSLSDALPDFRKNLELTMNCDEREFMPSGLVAVDQYVDGISRGNLAFICGFTSAFKTGSCVNWALNAVKLGYNVLYVTMENSYSELLNQFISCHAANMDLFGSVCQRPPTHTDIGRGTLSREQFNLVDTAYQDLVFKCDKGVYGNLYIDNPNVDPTLSYIRHISSFYNAKCNQGLDMIVIDAPNLMVSESNAHERDSRNAIIRSLKLFAGSFNRGKGIAVLCPHQINRDGHERAKKHTEFIYDHKCIADLNEIERSADIVLTIFSDDEELRLKNMMLVQFLKTRHHGAPKYQNFPVQVSMGTRRWDNCQMDRALAFDDTFDLEPDEEMDIEI